MTSRSFIAVGCASALALLLATAVPLARAGQEGETPVVAKKVAPIGLYLGVIQTKSVIRGDFDGESMLIAPGEEAFSLPKFDIPTATGFTFGIGTGRGADDRFFFDIRRTSVTHQGTFLGAVTPAELALWTVGFRALYAKSFLQPFIRGGFKFGTLTVRDGSVSAAGAVGDAVFNGSGVELAAGLSIMIPPCFSLFAEAGIDSLDFRGVTGVLNKHWATSDLWSEGLGGGGGALSIGILLIY